jgi:plasmid maintenance system killer protein
LTYSGGILADKKNVFSVTIDKKDLMDLNSALSKHFKKLEANNQKIYGKEINADYFLTNFLVRRIISKALVKYRKREKN